MIKLGVIIPTVNTVSEPEMNAIKPDNVTVHFTRMPIHFQPEKDNYRKLMDDLQIRLDEVALFGANIVAYNCTVGSMACPTELLTRRLESIGVPGVSTAPSMIHALQTLGVKKISLATPYSEAVNKHEKAYLESYGFTVLQMAGMSFDAIEPELGRQFAEVPSNIIYDHALSAVHPQTEVVFLSCANFQTAGLVDQLEAKLNIPVITSNIVTLWAALRKGGIMEKTYGYGKLLREY